MPRAEAATNLLPHLSSGSSLTSRNFTQCLVQAKFSRDFGGAPYTVSGTMAKLKLSLCVAKERRAAGG